MVKAQEIFLDHFARLGIFSKVQSLAGPPESSDTNDDNDQVLEQGKKVQILCLSGNNYRVFD